MQKRWADYESETSDSGGELRHFPLPRLQAAQQHAQEQNAARYVERANLPRENNSEHGHSPGRPVHATQESPGVCYSRRSPSVGNTQSSAGYPSTQLSQRSQGQWSPTSESTRSRSSSHEHVSVYVKSIIHP